MQVRSALLGEQQRRAAAENTVATERRQLVRACGGVEDVEVGGSVVTSIGGWVWV